MSVQRYDVRMNGPLWNIAVSDDGKWVKYEDHRAEVGLSEVLYWWVIDTIARKEDERG